MLVFDDVIWLTKNIDDKFYAGYIECKDTVTNVVDSNHKVIHSKVKEIFIDNAKEIQEKFIYQMGDPSCEIFPIGLVYKHLNIHDEQAFEIWVSQDTGMARLYASFKQSSFADTLNAAGIQYSAKFSASRSNVNRR